MVHACSLEEIRAIFSCMDSFFLERPVLESTASTTNPAPARILKSSDEIKAAWQEILDRRRVEEKDDTAPIVDPERLKRMFKTWMNDFLREKLTAEQKKKDHSKQTSMFAAYMKNNFGGKPFVMGLWQTGIQWAPPTSMLTTDHNGALEHVTTESAVL